MEKLPERVRSGASAFFQRRADLYALRRGAATSRRKAAITEVIDDAHARYEVYEGTPPAGLDPADIVPVYAAGEGGPIAVPTGRVFVRLREGVKPDERRADLAGAGFEIERTLPYAPGAVWLRPIEDGVGAALNGLASLEALPDVAHVEPQMLLERAFRTS